MSADAGAALMGDLWTPLRRIAEALHWSRDGYIQRVTKTDRIHVYLVRVDDLFTRPARREPIALWDPSLGMHVGTTEWFGPNLVRPDYVQERNDRGDHRLNPRTGRHEPWRSNNARPRKEEIAALNSVWLDIDFGANKAHDEYRGLELIDRVSGKLGTRPELIIKSGHGLQPIWAVTGGQITEQFDTTSAATLLVRFNELAVRVADELGLRVDNVSDPSRVLRLPNSINAKNVAVQVPVTFLGSAS